MIHKMNRGVGPRGGSRGGCKCKEKVVNLKKVVCIYSDAKLDNCKTGVIDCKIHKGDDTSNEALIKVQHLYYLNRAGKLNANYLINQPVAFVLLLLGQCDFKFIK